MIASPETWIVATEVSVILKPPNAPNVFKREDCGELSMMLCYMLEGFKLEESMLGAIQQVNNSVQRAKLELVKDSVERGELQLLL